MSPSLRLIALATGIAVAAPGRAQTLPTHNNVVYATVPLDAGGMATLSMDVWEATSGVAHAPLAIWIHGGGWQSGSYNNPPPGLNALLSAGFAVASVQYRLSGVAIFPAQIHDVKGATRFLRAHANDYGLDPSRFAAWGSSAGGHLTALLATSSGVPELEGATGGNLAHSSSLQAAVDYYGPTNLLTMTADHAGAGSNHDGPNSAESHLIGFDDPGQGIGVLRDNLDNPAPPFPEKAALVALTNPINFVDPADPPMFLAHGTVDTNVPIKQSERLAEALAAVGVEHVLRPVIGAGHGFTTQTAAVNAEAVAFLVDKLLQPPGDYDRNDAVDGADFLLWQRHVGSTASIPGAAADGNVDGAVDAEDLDVWQAAIAPHAKSIPEPATICLFAVALAVALLRRTVVQMAPSRS